MTQIRKRQFGAISLLVLSSAVCNSAFPVSTLGASPPKGESKTTDRQPLSKSARPDRSRVYENIRELTQRIFASAKTGDFKGELAARKAMVSFVRSEYGDGHWRESEEQGYIKSLQQTLQLDAQQQKRIAKARVLGVESATLYQAGLLRSALSKAKESLEIYRSVLGESDMSFLNVLTHIGTIQEKLLRFQDSQRSYTKAIKLRLQLLGKPTLVDALIMNNLATVHMTLKDLDKAETVLLQTTRIMRNKGAHSIYQGAAHFNLAKTYNLRKKFSQAESAAIEADRHLESVLPQQYPYFINNRLELARSHMGQKKFAQATTVYKDVVSRYPAFSEKYRQPASKQIELFENYAAALQANGDKGTADEYRAKAAKLRKFIFGTK